MDQLSDFMAQVQNTMIPEEDLQFCVTVIPDFNETESCVVLKIHHVITDGLGLMILMGILQDNYMPEQFI